MQPGIHHIELWVKDLSQSVFFYKNLLELLGWRQIGKAAFSTDTLEIYLLEMPHLVTTDTLGVRHLCFRANSENQLKNVADFLESVNAQIIRGPIQMDYTEGYFTLDFYDPNHLIIEVAYIAT